jgi:carboxyl-terminal processing protease
VNLSSTPIKLAFIFLTSASIPLCVNAQVEPTKLPLSETTSPTSEATPLTKSTLLTKPTLPLEDLRNFVRVFDQVRNGYVKDVTDSELFEYAIKGMIAELDPHSAYLDKDAYAELQAAASGEFGGVGLEVGLDEGFIKVITPLDGSPSQKAGIRPGDIIVRLDDISMKGKTLSDAGRILRGPKGSSVKISLERKGSDTPLEMVLLRDLIQVQSVSVKPLADDYLYIRIAQFQVDSARDFTERLTSSLKQRPRTKGLILDLRNNPGGVLQASVEVADALLESGLIVYTQGRMDGSSLAYKATPGDISKGLPLVVLINSGSASASEIVAGALQDQTRAVVMGTRSFGKGSVQSVMPITEDRAIKLTTALYYTPKGRSIQALGIEPDVRLEKATLSAENKLARAETDLPKHIPNKSGEKTKVNTRDYEQAVSDDILKDNQVLDAVNLLKGSHILGKPDPVLTKPEATMKFEATTQPEI